MEENRIEEIGKKCQEQPHKYKDSSFNFDKCSEESQDVKFLKKRRNQTITKILLLTKLNT